MKHFEDNCYVLFAKHQQLELFKGTDKITLPLNLLNLRYNHMHLIYGVECLNMFQLLIVCSPIQ